ncbi:MAG: helix-turn-helix domain-containing protein [Legionellales bacterium]|jgi:transcriptional regulator with XRE-family HTH domain
MSELSQVLSHLLKVSGNLSGTELARRVELPSATVNRLITGSVQDPRISTLKAIAKYFNISFDQLLGYSPLPKQFNLAHNRFAYSFQMPVFELNQIHNKLDKDDAAGSRLTWQSNDNYEQNDLFAIKLEQANFEPTFLKGSTLIANKSLAPQINDYVLVSIQGKEATIRRYYTESGETYLYPLRSELPVINAEQETVKILGVILESQTRLRAKPEQAK